jgi:Family of unknown function (DUF5678)
MTELDLKRLDDWYTEHFEELVEKYPGKAVAMVNGEIVEVGDSERGLDRRARKRYPGETPFVIRVPTEQELICL